MFQLSTSDMSQLLRFALRFHDTPGFSNDLLSNLPGDLNSMLRADRTFVCQISAGAAQMSGFVRRIQDTAPVHVKKWSNGQCVLRTYASSNDIKNGTGHEILSIGRHHATNQIVCGAFSRAPDREPFTVSHLTMSHFAMGYAFDSIRLAGGKDGLAIEATHRNRRRVVVASDVVLLRRINRFMSGL